MKRLRAIFFNTTTILSFLLLIASLFLWVRSYKIGDCIKVGHGNVWQAWMSARGQFLYLRCRKPGPDSNVLQTPLQHVTEPVTRDVAAGQWLVKDFRGFAGFAYGQGTAPDYIGWAYVIPLWFISAASATCAAPIGIVAFYKRRKRRLSPGLCPNCGYDLRATPDRCPECGRIPVELNSAIRHPDGATATEGSV